MATMTIDSARARVLGEIEGERSKQDEQWGGAEHDDSHAPQDWLEYIENQTSKARMSVVDARHVDGAPNEYGAVRARLVKVAALAVAGIESIDRCVEAE